MKVVLITISIILAFVVLHIQAALATNSVNCPSGTYEIDRINGNPICKAEPTGCPYGDSIPLGPDCDKHKPIEAPAPIKTPVAAPVVDYPATSWGK